MARTGRPIELTPELIVKAYTLAKECLYVECIAGLLGISRSTLYAWMRRGARERRRRERGLLPREKEQSFLDFSDSVQKGFAESEKADLETIRQAASVHGIWQAAAWRLERTHPERWGLERAELQRLKKLIRQLAEDRGLDPETGEPKHGRG